MAEETVFRGFTSSRWPTATFTAPDGTRFERDIVRHPGAVAVVAVTDDGAVVLVRQYRASVDRWILEIPAGTRDVDGEPAAETAGRELAEEAGYRADRLTLLAEILNTPGFCDESTGIYLATGLTPVPDERHGVEERYLTGRGGRPRPLRRHGRRRLHRRRPDHPRGRAGPAPAGRRLIGPWAGRSAPGPRSTSRG